MRTFAVLSFAVAALAAPAAFIRPDLVNKIRAVVPVTAPITVPAKANANAHSNVVANVKAAAANIAASYNNIGNGDADDNNVKVLSRGLAGVFAPVTVPAKANANAVTDVFANAKAAVANVKATDNNVANNAANYNKVNVLSRGVVDALAPITAVLNGLIDLCTQVGVNANAAIANVNAQNNNILNNVGNSNNVKVANRAAVDAVTPVLTNVFAVVKALTSAGVDSKAIIANIDATCNEIANNVGNGNNVNVLSRGVVDAVAPIVAVVQALVEAFTKLGVSVSADVLNIALKNNNILNNDLNGNNVNAL